MMQRSSLRQSWADYFFFSVLQLSIVWSSVAFSKFIAVATLPQVNFVSPTVSCMVKSTLPPPLRRKTSSSGVR